MDCQRSPTHAGSVNLSLILFLMLRAGGPLPNLGHAHRAPDAACCRSRRGPSSVSTRSRDLTVVVPELGRGVQRVHRLSAPPASTSSVRGRLVMLKAPSGRRRSGPLPADLVVRQIPGVRKPRALHPSSSAESGQHRDLVQRDLRALPRRVGPRRPGSPRSGAGRRRSTSHPARDPGPLTPAVAGMSLAMSPPMTAPWENLMITAGQRAAIVHVRERLTYRGALRPAVVVGHLVVRRERIMELRGVAP